MFDDELKYQIINILKNFENLANLNQNYGSTWLFIKSLLKEKISKFKLLSIKLNRKNFNLNKYKYNIQKKFVSMSTAPSGLSWDMLNQMTTEKKGDSIISQLIHNGNILTNNDELTEHIFETFKNQFNSKPCEELSNSTFLKNLPKLSDKYLAIGDQITLQEVQKAIREAKCLSSPGRDGLPNEFYKLFHLQLCDILLKVYNELLIQGVCPAGFNEVDVVLIPKKEMPESLSDWRPISLLNNDYKLLTSILSRRLYESLPSIINEEQTCSIKGRGISTNISCARDILQSRRIRKGFLVFLDQEKAFDNVTHSYLLSVLIAFGYPQDFVKWIKILLNDSLGRVINGQNITNDFPFLNGIKQGDSLSPLLYILAIEPLLKRLKNKLSALGLGNSATIKLVYLAYADDIILCIRNIKGYLDFLGIYSEFSKITGAKLNINKTTIIPMSDDSRLQAERAGFKTSLGHKVLGVYLGSREFELKNWTMLAASLDNLIESLIRFNGFFTIFDRCRIINSVFLSKALYVLRYIDAPEKWIDRIMGKIRKFVNDNKHWPKRSFFHQCRQEGGLGLIDLAIHKKTFQILEVLDSLTESNNNLYYKSVFKFVTFPAYMDRWVNPYFHKITRWEEMQLPKSISEARRTYKRFKDFRLSIKSLEVLKTIIIEDYIMIKKKTRDVCLRLNLLTFNDFCEFKNENVTIPNELNQIAQLWRDTEIGNLDNTIFLYYKNELLSKKAFKSKFKKQSIKSFFLKSDNITFFHEDSNLFTISYSEKAWRLRRNAGVTPIFLNQIGQKSDTTCPICQVSNAGLQHMLHDCSFAKHIHAFLSLLLQTIGNDTDPKDVLLCGLSKSKEKREAVISDVAVICVATIQDQLYAAYNNCNYDGKRLLCKRIFSFRAQEKDWYGKIGRAKEFFERWGKFLLSLKSLYQ